MGSHVSKTGLYISTTIYTALTLALALWGSYFIHILIYIVPLALVAIFYRFAFLHDIAFSENKYASSVIIGSIIILVTTFILFPLVEVVKNYIFINLVNFGAMYGAKLFLLRAIGMALIMLAVFIGLFILINRTQNNSGSIFDNIDRKVFKENEDTIITYLKGQEATSSVSAINKPRIFNDDALKFLVKKRIVIKTADGKYYLRRTALKDLEYKTDLRFDIVFIACILVLYALIFALIGQTNEANGPVDYYVVSEGYSYIKPEGYVATVGSSEDSSILFPKEDITGDSGAIYFSVFNIKNPGEISKEAEVQSLKNKYSVLPEIVKYSNNTYNTPNGNYVVSNLMTFSDHYETADYIYLVNKSGICEKVVLVESRYFGEDSPVAADAKSIVDSIENKLK